MFVKTEQEIRDEITRVAKIIERYKKMDLDFLVIKYNGYLEALLWVLGENQEGYDENNSRSGR